jgi:serine/threonine protein kinase
LKADLILYVSCGDKAFVLKRLSPSIFAQWFYKHKLDLPGTHRILAPVDYNVEEKTVVYEYLKEDLLSLVQNNPDFPVAARKQILFEVGKALQELHAKNKIHIGMKLECPIWLEFHSSFILDVQPGHVMVDWSLGQQGQVLIERVALIDPGISMESSGDGLIRLPPFTPRLGNWWWRSPEGHTGQGIGKPSDLFSFGLVVSELHRWQNIKYLNSWIVHIHSHT